MRGCGRAGFACMGLSLWHIAVVLLIVLLLFGAGRLPRLMGELGRGVGRFRAGLRGGDAPPEDRTEPTRRP